jgi:hypothetical protein
MTEKEEEERCYVCKQGRFCKRTEELAFHQSTDLGYVYCRLAFGLAVGAACAFSLGIAGHVLTFRTRARLSFAPPPCRMPLGQSQDIPQTDPGGMAPPGFDIV